MVWHLKIVSDLRQVVGFFPVSFTNKPDRHDITEILLKVALNTITITHSFYYRYVCFYWELYICFWVHINHSSQHIFNLYVRHPIISVVHDHKLQCYQIRCLHCENIFRYSQTDGPLCPSNFVNQWTDHSNTVHEHKWTSISCNIHEQTKQFRVFRPNHMKVITEMPRAH